MSLTFKESGAYDFFTYFSRLRERLEQAVSVARESGYDAGETGNSMGPGALAGVNLDHVHLDELPAYEASRNDAVAEMVNGIPSPPLPQGSTFGSPPQMSPQQESFQPPTEPPPGYEEVQRDSVVEELERRLRISNS